MGNKTKNYRDQEDIVMSLLILDESLGEKYNENPKEFAAIIVARIKILQKLQLANFSKKITLRTVTKIIENLVKD